MRLSRRSRLTSAAAAMAAGSLVLAACGGDGGGSSEEGSGPKFQIAYNTDGGHKAWVDAVTNGLKNELGIAASGKPYATFDEVRTLVTDRKIKEAFRTGWQPDYPSIFNYLAPIYGTGAGSNDGDYSSPEFDDLMKKIGAAQSEDEQNQLQTQAQAVLMEDLPAIPLWYTNIAAAAAKGVENVKFNWQNLPEYQELTKPGGGFVSVHGTQPQNPLIPAATNETGGGNPLTMLYSGLIGYKADGTSQNDVAQSIESTDNVTWTVKLKPNQKFSDGSPVAAKSFVDAWNYGSVAKNKQLSSYFYYPIKGFDEAQADKAEGLSGLKVVDPLTFTIELNQAEASFPDRLGYSAFFPLPDSALAAMKKGPEALTAWGQKPITNGPYKLSAKGWQQDVSIEMVPNEQYNGPRKAKNDGLLFRFYNDLDSAYTDVQAGNLDVLDTVPDSATATFQEDDKVQPFSEPGSIFQSFTIPVTFDHFKMDEEGKLRRKAISMAIDREAITEKIFNGTRTPAKDFSSPVMPGYNDAIPGNEVLEYNPDEAKKLWEQANEINAWD